MFVASKVLNYEDWLLICNWGRAMMMGDNYIDLTPELYKEIEDAHTEYMRRKYPEYENFN